MSIFIRRVLIAFVLLVTALCELFWAAGRRVFAPFHTCLRRLGCWRRDRLSPRWVPLPSCVRVVLACQGRARDRFSFSSVGPYAHSTDAGTKHKTRLIKRSTQVTTHTGDWTRTYTAHNSLLLLITPLAVQTGSDKAHNVSTTAELTRIRQKQENILHG